MSGGVFKRADANARVDELEARVAELGAHLTEVARKLAVAEDKVAAAANKLAYLDPDDAGRARAVGEDALARADNAQGVADAALDRAAVAEGRGGDALAKGAVALDTAHEALVAANVLAFMSWIELSPPGADVSISVVLPTRDRPDLLPRAVSSVLAQAHPTWQLVIVDDGDTDAVEQTLANVDDARVVVVPGPRQGLGAARNAGLDGASGDVICYLDDDNVMHPAWLQAVAHVFSTRADVDVAYGVTLTEHRVPGTLDPDGWWPSFWQLPWSRPKLLEQNLTDAGALAHRRELDEARFDGAMGEDWDLLIRLTADRAALAVPAISHAYAVGGGDHMSHTPDHRAALEDVRRRHRRADDD